MMALNTKLKRMSVTDGIIPFKLKGKDKRKAGYTAGRATDVAAGIRTELTLNRSQNRYHLCHLARYVM